MKGTKISSDASAVVTGAGSGIGRAFALELHRRGGRVVCSDINIGTAEETACMINDEGGSATAVACDVASLEQVQKLAEAARDWFGGAATLLVNNAGVGVGGQNLEEISMEDWHWIMGINLWGVIHGCHVFVPEMKARGVGGVINVASAASFGAAPRMGAYNATKSAVVALSETLHAEVSGTGIHVTALCPTLVKTDVIKNSRLLNGNGQSKASLMAKDRAQALMDRFGHSPESVAKKTLKGLDQNQMYVLPQLDARVAWLLKRLTPGNFVRFNGLMKHQLQ
ncbi:MAG: SDR family NAD(P)-dependent oxidoreductase [Ketobacteraceae bacterium]|nr:SDR family NAD(P)-dependent oxidoreductase [Ketobacteraceae bacterium]